MRARQSGVITTVGSMGAFMSDPLIGLYHSSKAAVRSGLLTIAPGLEVVTSVLWAINFNGFFLGLSLTLNNEISPFNIKTCPIEPGYFRTSLLAGTGSIILPNTIIEDYREINDTVKSFLIERDHKQNGDPKRAAQVIYDVLTSTGVAKGRKIPKTLALGSDAVELVTRENEEFNTRIKEWAAISESTDFPPDQKFY